jgi:hypothetical protein
LSDPTQEVGSSGIAAIIWAADYRKSTIGKSNAGVLFAVMLRRYERTAIRETGLVGRANAKRCCNGHTIHSFEASVRQRSPHQAALPDYTRRLCAKALICLALPTPIVFSAVKVGAKGDDMLIDDFSRQDLTSKLGTQWRGVSDKVMGGISDVAVTHDVIDGRPCLRLTGDVRLENRGGFLQSALDLASSGDTFDASGYAGVRVVVRGNGEQYSVHLRTPDNIHPWQSYRAHFTAGRDWETIDLPFAAFAPYRLDVPLDISRLRRLGLVAIGRAFFADLAVSELGFYRQPYTNLHK